MSVSTPGLADARLVEGVVDALAHLPLDVPVGHRACRDHAADLEALGSEVLHAPDLVRPDDVLAPHRVLGELGRHPGDDRLGGGHVGVQGDRDVEGHPAPLLREVAHPLDVAVEHVPLDPVEVAEGRGAQSHPLDLADLAVDVDPVADAVLVLDEHRDAGQHVAHELLGAEADHDPQQAGAGQHRLQRDAEGVHDRQHGDDPDQRPATPCITPVMACRRCRRRLRYCSVSVRVPRASLRASRWWMRFSMPAAKRRTAARARRVTRKATTRMTRMRRPMFAVPAMRASSWLSVAR
jgi:hypothetical protein